jgi:hypothetical protein
VAVRGGLSTERFAQATALLWPSDGLANDEVARQHTTNDSVRARRPRFEVEESEGVGEIVLL